MTTKINKIIFPLIILAVVVVGTIALGAIGKEYISEISLETVEKAAVQSEIVGRGYSTKKNPEEAVMEAVNMALQDKIDKTPNFAIIFASSGSDMQAVFLNAKKMLGNGVKIYGGTSDSRAVMTDQGFVKVTERGYEQALMEGDRGLAIMTVNSPDITFGVGSANFANYSTSQEASKTAILNAIKSAGKSQDELPNAVLMTTTIGAEEEVIEGIEEIIEKNTPLLGGTAGGPELAVFGENEIYKEGVSLAAIYTDLPIGLIFEGGFDVTSSHSGIVTKVDGQVIVEIDNRPALNVYNEWLDGEIDRLYKEIGEPDLIRDLLTLHPLYRKYTSPNGETFFLFSHPWPKDDTLKDRSVMTSTKIKVGERIYLSHGAWEILVNRIGNLPHNAKINGGFDVNKKPILGIGHVCAGVMGIIPEAEREKLPLLINRANNNAPFIANFTWGEQGPFKGVGNKHGNLLSSFLVIMPE